MGSQAKPEEKFAMIRAALSQPGNMLKVIAETDGAGECRAASSVRGRTEKGTTRARR